jgi:hypothetical protein
MSTTLLQNYPGSKQKSFKITKNAYSRVRNADQGESTHVENTSGLNLAVVKLKTVQMTKLQQ